MFSSRGFDPRSYEVYNVFGGIADAIVKVCYTGKRGALSGDVGKSGVTLSEFYPQRDKVSEQGDSLSDYVTCLNKITGVERSISDLAYCVVKGNPRLVASAFVYVDADQGPATKYLLHTFPKHRCVKASYEIWGEHGLCIEIGALPSKGALDEKRRLSRERRMDKKIDEVLLSVLKKSKAKSMTSFLDPRLSITIEDMRKSVKGIKTVTCRTTSGIGTIYKERDEKPYRQVL